MLAGHFGLAAGVRPSTPAVPLWSLMLATQALDVVFVPLLLAGIEGFDPVDPAHPSAYGGSLFHAAYSHSLVGAALIAVVAGAVASRWWQRTGGLVIGGVVFSHWLLDLVTHRPDLPILPGNLGNLPLLGLGLWRLPLVTALVELAFVLGGAALYARGAWSLPVPPGESRAASQRRAAITAGVTAALMVLVLAADVAGLG